jgi:hypothetical protein
MGVFGFIENFFFISLGIAFALILLLVYHFKNRMSVAEKKSETMYGLLSSVVKEIKSLRNMFGITPSPTVIPEAPASKSTPEVEVEMKEVIRVDLNRSPSNSNKIVVSDEEDSEEDEEYSDSETESESEDEDDEDELSVEDLTPAEETPVESLVQDQEPVVEPVQDQDQVVEHVELSVEETLEQIHAQEEKEKDQDQELSSESEDTKQKYTVDQLKKMNINQLKTISIQSGIETDISKLKKHDLITLILEKTQ